MKIQWREDMVNPVPLVSCQLQCQFRKLRQTLKQHQHLWFANPLNRRDQAPWGCLMNFHEFPQFQTPSFYPTHLFGGMDNFFRPNKNSMRWSSCEAIFLRWGLLSEWCQEGEGMESLKHLGENERKCPGQNLPRYLGLFIFCISGWCSTFKAF